MDLSSALGDDGFRWIFVIHQHGSPAHNRAQLEAADHFRDTYHGVMAPLTSYRYAAVSDRPSVWTSSESQENAGDVHGGAVETSRILFLRPELVHNDYRSAIAQTAPSDEDLVRVATAPNWPGYFGSPRLSRADAGAAIMRQLADDLTSLALRILDGFDPRTLPNRGDAGDGAFKVLDSNLLNRSDSLETRESDWLRQRNLK